MEAAGDLAQLVERAGQLRGDAVQVRGQLVGLGWQRCPHRAQLQREGDQPLLRAVVQSRSIRRWAAWAAATSRTRDSVSAARSGTPA